MSSMASFSSLIAAAMLLMPTGPPPNLSMIVRSNLRSTSSKPRSSTSSSFSASSGDLFGDGAVGTHLRVIANAPQQPVRNARRSAGSPRELRGGALVDRDVQYPRRPLDDFLQIRFVVEIEAVDDAKARPQRPGQQSRAVVAPINVNFWSGTLIDRAPGPCPMMMSSS